MTFALASCGQPPCLRTIALTTKRTPALTLKLITGDIVCPQGFLASAVAAGVKKVDGKLDLGLLYSTRPSIAAARFTTNVVKAAPLLLSQVHLEKSGGEIRAIIVNSGNANACTGESGMQVAKQMAELGSQILGISAQQLLVASTGVIGVQLPFERLEKQAGALKEGLKREAIGDVAKAIMTTDTVRKVCSAEVPIAGK